MGLVEGMTFGHPDLASRSAFPFRSEIHTRNFGLELGSLRVGTVVFLTPWYQEVSLQWLVPGLTEAVNILVWDYLVTMTWKWNCLQATEWPRALCWLGAKMSCRLALWRSLRASNTLLLNHFALWVLSYRCM